MQPLPAQRACTQHARRGHACTRTCSPHSPTLCSPRPQAADDEERARRKQKKKDKKAARAGGGGGEGEGKKKKKRRRNEAGDGGGGEGGAGGEPGPKRRGGERVGWCLGGMGGLFASVEGRGGAGSALCIFACVLSLALPALQHVPALQAGLGPFEAAPPARGCEGPCLSPDHPRTTPPERPPHAGSDAAAERAGEDLGQEDSDDSEGVEDEQDKAFIDDAGGEGGSAAGRGVGMAGAG